MTNVFKPEIWSKVLLNDVMNYGVMLDCVNRNWEGEIKEQGDSVHIQKIGAITINTHNESNAISYQTLENLTVKLTIDQAKEFAFKVSDIDQIQANTDMVAKYTAKAKKEIVNVKDSYLHALAISGVASANQFGTIAITKDNIYSTLLNMYTKLACSNALDASGKGEDGKNPFIILPPQVIAIIKNSAEAKNATTLGDDTIRRGAIMQYAGFDIKQSTNLTYNSGYSILAGTTEAVTYAEQIAKVESVKDKDYFGDFVRGLYLYGAKVVEPTFLASATFTIASTDTDTDTDTDSDTDSDTDTDTDTDSDTDTDTEA